MPSVGRYSENADKSKNEASARVIYTSAIAELAANPKLEGDTLDEAAALASNVNKKSVNVVVDNKTKQVTYITYTSDKGMVIKYDGTGIVHQTPGSK